jgi:hypothetical protein
MWVLARACMMASGSMLGACYKETEAGKRRKGEESKQESERHTQETGPTQQHRPTQNTAEAAKATQEHKPTGTEKSNNLTQHTPEKARPPKATHTDTKRKSATAAQNRETRTKERAPCPGRPQRRRANPDARTHQAPAARGHKAHHCRGRKGNRPPLQC